MSDLRTYSVTFCLKSGRTLKTDPLVCTEDQAKNNVKTLIAVLSTESSIDFVSGGSLHILPGANVDYVMFDMQEHDDSE